MTIDYDFYKKLTNISAPRISRVALKTLQMAHATENAWTMRVTFFAPVCPSEQLSIVAIQSLSAPPVLKERAVVKGFSFGLIDHINKN